MSCETSRCEMHTKDGNKCQYVAKTYDEITKKQVCIIHSRVCRNLYKEYKTVCNKVWKKKCNKKTSITELNNYVKWAKECQRRRIEFVPKCVVESMDQSHYYAIKKMSDIIDKCEDERKKQIERMFGEN